MPAISNRKYLLICLRKALDWIQMWIVMFRLCKLSLCEHYHFLQEEVARGTRFGCRFSGTKLEELHICKSCWTFRLRLEFLTVHFDLPPMGSNLKQFICTSMNSGWNISLLSLTWNLLMSKYDPMLCMSWNGILNYFILYKFVVPNYRSYFAVKKES